MVIFSLALLLLDPKRFLATTMLISSFVFLKTPGLSPNRSTLTVRSRPRSPLSLVQYLPWPRSQDLCISGWSSQSKIISCRWTCSQCHCGRVTTLAHESWSNCVKKMKCYKQFLYLQDTEEENFSAIFRTLSAKTWKKTWPKGSLATYKDVSVGEHGVVDHGLQQVARGTRTSENSDIRL